MPWSTAACDYLASLALTTRIQIYLPNDVNWPLIYAETYAVKKKMLVLLSHPVRCSLVQSRMCSVQTVKIHIQIQTY